MGYYTSYTLKVHEGDIEIQDVLSANTEEIRELEYAMDEDGESSESVKWYDHEKDMTELSKLYPNIVFELHGEGEEAGIYGINTTRAVKLKNAMLK